MGHARSQTPAVVPAAGIALMGVIGSLHAAGLGFGAFDLDGEYTVPAIYSSGLLVVAAGFALATARAFSNGDRTAFLVVGGLLVFLGLDELLSVHERVDSRLGLDWQVVYAPLAGAFAWAAWRVVRSLGSGSVSARLLYAGAGAWVLSQILEAFEFADLTPGLVDAEGKTAAQIHEATHSLAFYAMSIPEELLEMTGSLLFALAFAASVRRRADSPH